MSMFDYIRCAYPLPVPVSGERLWQTKDAPGFPMMDLYEIRSDGTLWHEAYDVEDRSDPRAEGLKRLYGMRTRVNERWEQVRDFTGEIRFYDFKDRDGGWLEFSAYFVNGALAQLHCVENTDARTVETASAPQTD